MRLLIADRQPETRSALRMLLQEEASLTEVSEAGDSEEVLRQIASSRPDIVVLDWDLPGLPAPALLADIRRLGNHTCVLVLSGRPEVAQNALAAGADAFVSKTEPPRQLVTVLNNFAARKGCQ